MFGFRYPYFIVLGNSFIYDGALSTANVKHFCEPKVFMLAYWLPGILVAGFKEKFQRRETGEQSHRDFGWVVLKKPPRI